MPEPLSNPSSRYLVSPLRTLYEVCRAAGRDRDGAACPVCPVSDICASDRENEAARALRAARSAVRTCADSGPIAA